MPPDGNGKERLHHVQRKLRFPTSYAGQTHTRRSSRSGRSQKRSASSRPSMRTTSSGGIPAAYEQASLPVLRCTTVTNEHAIPQWIGAVLPGDGPWRHGHTERHGDEPMRGWVKGGPDLKCKAACRTCNGGWMSQLEGRAKPVLTPVFQGYPSRLGPHDLELIAYWALKTVLMLDRCSDADHQTIAKAEYAAVYTAQTVLQSTHVWLGKCEVARGSWFHARTVPGSRCRA